MHAAYVTLPFPNDVPDKRRSMTAAVALPIALCLFSAVTVALVNFLVKKGGDILTGRMVLEVAMALIVLPFAFIVPLPPQELWGAMALATVVHWGYQFALIRALHRGDLSLVFPVMRGLAPLMTAILAVFILKEYLNVIQIIGLLAATSALILFAVPTADTDEKRSLDKRALVWAVLTAVGIGAYATVDAAVVRAMPSPYTFIVWLFLLDCIGITSVTLWVRRGQVIEHVKPVLKANIIGGFFGVASYGAAIYAYTLLDASLVTALRETSVVFAAILGAVFLKEGFGPRRMIAAGILATGLVLMRVAA